MTNNALLTKPIEYEVNGETVKLSGEIVKQYIVKGGTNVTDQELVMFLNLCKYQKLNPFLNEAYLVKFSGSPAQIIVSKEAFMKRAESHEHYKGLEAGIIVDRNGEMVEIEGAVCLDNDKLIGGWAKVFRNDREKPVTVKISYKEFSKGQSTWKQMPNNMIRKVAVVNALREAFPEKLNAMYTDDETNPNIQMTDTQELIQQNANKQYIDIDTQPVQEVIEPPKQETQPIKQATKQEEPVKVEVKKPSEFPTGEPHQQSVFDQGIFQ